QDTNHFKVGWIEGFVVRREHLRYKQIDDRCAACSCEKRNHERRHEPKCRVTRQQISCSAEPCQERRERNGIDGRDMPAMTGTMRATCSMSAEVPVQAGQLDVKVWQMQTTRQEHEHAQKEAGDETDQVKISPGHSRSPLPPFVW